MIMTQDYQADIEDLMHLIGAKILGSAALESSICTGITEDSRKVSGGDVFIARPGLESDGRGFIDQATENGAVAILCEATDIKQFEQVKNCSTVTYQVNNLAGQLGALGDEFFQHPSEKLRIVGVTGTNGKTSCCQLIAQVVANLDEKVAVMGTLGNGLMGEMEATPNTTMDALTLQANLSDYVNQGCGFVAMEVSSHALTQGRVNGVRFNVALFTNLTRDHLDYHGDMGSYAEAKKCLFTQKELEAVVINADDAMGADLMVDPDIRAEKFSFSITPTHAQEASHSVWTESVVFHDGGIKAEIITPWGSTHFKTPMMGQFNLSNCLAVITTLGVMGYRLEDVVAQLETVDFVKGRMERFGGDGQPLVIVDYAHTPDALKHVLQAIKPHTQHKLWCVFGCGGDRDRGKRSEMAAISEEYADHLVFTTDNPRNESPENIVAEMLEGLSNPSACEVEYDRKLAIHNSIAKAVVGDVVLVAGKGHEQFQQIGKQQRPHCDAQVVQQALAMGSWR